jgi:mono/diheme cytochrome c family protein
MCHPVQRVDRLIFIVARRVNRRESGTDACRLCIHPTFFTAAALLIGKVKGGIIMRSVLLTATLCLGLAATAAAQDAKVAKGQQLFTDQKCTLCHSIGDKGNKKGPLDEVATKLSGDEIRSWITDAKGMTAKTKATRKPEMKAYTLPKEDVEALAAYLQTLKK